MMKQKHTLQQVSEVVYVPYPRSGLMSGGGRDYEQLTKVMCADDKAAAMHAFKTRTNVAAFEDVEVTSACREQVANGFNLGQEIGISGYPVYCYVNRWCIARLQPRRSDNCKNA